MGGARPGVGAMTEIAPETRAFARALRNDMTRAERRLWGRLRELNRMLGTHFRRQAPVGPYIADFAELGRRLVIEVDGAGHGGARDAARDAWFARQGFAVVRFWNPEVEGNLDGVVQAVLDALEGTLDPLAGSPPTPSLPHEGGGRRLRPNVARGSEGSGTR